MQKWCPEPLVVSTPAVGAFEPWRRPPGRPSTRTPPVSGPRPASADPHSLLRQLSRDERAQIVELLEQDLRREYEERCAREAAAQQQAEAERVQADIERHERWQRELAEGLRREVRDALLHARAPDRGHGRAHGRQAGASRGGRTIPRSSPVPSRPCSTAPVPRRSVTVHPDDAAWLEARGPARAPAHRRRSRDRRIERGGCLVAADGRSGTSPSRASSTSWPKWSRSAGVPPGDAARPGRRREDRHA